MHSQLSADISQWVDDALTATVEESENVLWDVGLQMSAKGPLIAICFWMWSNLSEKIYIQAAALQEAQLMAVDAGDIAQLVGEIMGMLRAKVRADVTGTGELVVAHEMPPPGSLPGLSVVK